MPHQCVHCSRLYPNAAKELIEGCKCGSHFFFFIKDEVYEKLKNEKSQILEIVDIPEESKQRIEREVREITGIREDEPVILDLESVRVLQPGKFEIDVVSLFNKQKPIVYKLGEGKYIIDIASSLNKGQKERSEKNAK